MPVTWAEVQDSIEAMNSLVSHEQRCAALVQVNSLACRAELAEALPVLDDVYWFARLAGHFALSLR